MEKPGLTVTLITATLYSMYRLRRETYHSCKVNIYPTVRFVLKSNEMNIQYLGINLKKELNNPFTLAMELFLSTSMQRPVTT